MAERRGWLKWGGGAALVTLAALFVALLRSPAPIEAAGWQPGQKPTMAGAARRNQALLKAEFVHLGDGEGPEDVAVGYDGALYTGVNDGRILRVDQDRSISVFANTGGRPLGLDVAPSGALIVADAIRGLLSISRTGRITVLATEADGKPFRCVNDVDVARDGTIYFTDSSARWSLPDLLYELLEARPSGRLLRYHPDTGKVETLLSGLSFANGVALSKDEDFLLVAECYRYQIVRYWLGDKEGQRDLLIQNIPGFPDGISSDEDGNFWIAIFTVRKDILDTLHPYPFWKEQLAKLPRYLWPKPKRYGLILGLNPAGQVATSLHDPEGKRVWEVTSVERVGEKLLFGTLNRPMIGIVPVPEVMFDLTSAGNAAAP